MLKIQHQAYDNPSKKEKIKCIRIRFGQNQKEQPLKQQAKSHKAKAKP